MVTTTNRRTAVVIPTMIAMLALVSLFAGWACTQTSPSSTQSAETAAAILSHRFQFEPTSEFAEYTVISGRSRSGTTDISIRAVPRKYTQIALQAPAKSGPRLSPADWEVFQATLATLIPEIENSWLDDAITSLDQHERVPAFYDDRHIFVERYENEIVLNFNTRWPKLWTQ